MERVRESGSSVSDGTEATAPRPPGPIERALLRMFTRRATVLSNRAVAVGFHSIELAGPELAKAKWAPGQKIQIAVGSFAARTYTPLEWNSDAGHTRILAFTHGSGPGSHWVRSVQPGTECALLGPRSSLDLPGLTGSRLIFGDETSFGLAASALQLGDKAQTVFEVSSTEHARAALSAIGIEDAELLERRPDGAHLAALEPRLRALATSSTRFVLTGQASSVQRLRKLLKQLGVPSAHILSKAYWAPGKTGLD